MWLCQLKYSKEWEAKIYATVSSFWSDIKACPIPMVVFRGEHSDVLTDGVFKKLQPLRIQDEHHVIAAAGHLFPLERPQHVAEKIISICD